MDKIYLSFHGVGLKQDVEATFKVEPCFGEVYRLYSVGFIVSGCYRKADHFEAPGLESQGVV